MARVHGGPAAGASIPDAQAANFVFNANQSQSPYYSRTSYYVRRADGDIYWTARPVAGEGGVGDMRQVDRAWHKLTHALGVDGPAAIRRSAAARKRLRRAVR